MEDGSGELERLARSFERHLRAENKADKTVKTYGEGVEQLIAFLATLGVENAVDTTRSTSRSSWWDFWSDALQ
jgi:hypothetical protein